MDDAKKDKADKEKDEPRKRVTASGPFISYVKPPDKPYLFDDEFASLRPEVESSYIVLGSGASRLTAHLVSLLKHLRDDLSPPSYRPAPRNAAAPMVAKTVWTLWGTETEKVWEVLLRWSDGGRDLQDACDEIVSIGFDQHHFTPEEALQKVEGWLTNEERNYQQAAVGLLQSILPAIPRESLSELTSKWTPTDIEKSLDTFGKALLQIFYRDPAWTLKTFLQWARHHDQNYDDLIAGTLKYVVVPLDGTEEYYRSLEQQLVTLRMAVRNESLKVEVRKLIKGVRDCKSKVMNETAHAGHGQGAAKQKYKNKRKV